jgi:glycosyltransferase involved in cell wall biosynthesis
MRICHIVEAAGGGSGRCVLSLVAGLIDRDHDVTVIYSPIRADKNFQDSLKTISGLKSFPLTMYRAVGLYDLGAALKLYLLLKKHGPFDIIHSHSSKAGGLARLVGLLLPGLQIYTPHAFVTLDPGASPLYGWIERILSWICRSIIPVSLQEKRHAIEVLKIAEHKLHTIPNGVSPDYPSNRSTARQILGYSDNDYVIGFVGRLSSQKNPILALESFAKISKSFTRAQLTIVGDGPLQERIKEKIRYLPCSDRIKLLSGYNGRDVMPGFDCLICSSDYEGFPLIFLEALTAGVPLVSTPVGGTDETILPGKTGFIAKGFSVNDLATALHTLLSLTQNTSLAASAINHGKNFTTEAVLDQTIALYQSLNKGIR